jgi:Protein of unknown function (DUF3572)
MERRPTVPRIQPVQQQEAEDIAVKALIHLAGDDVLLSRFLALTGMEPGHLRAAAAQPGFLAEVLAFFAADDASLLALAGASSVPPERIAEAAERLLPPVGDFS